MRILVRWCWGIFVVCLVLLVLGFLRAGYFLQTSPHQPIQSDLIVALGGDNGSRIIRAFELYQQGFADRVLLTGIEGGPTETQAYYMNWRARFLIDRGVKTDSLMFDAYSANSWEEAENTLRLLRKMNWQRVLVVSDPPHLRRLDLAWNKVFADSGKEYRLVSAPLNGWDPGQWWKNDNSAQYVISELIKLSYYIVAH